MSTLTFADTHNMVAFFEKPAKSDGFHEIIDFLNANQIRYALTVNPTIYTSCIEQFWATTMVKTVNGERQLQALVDKKKVIITETSTRSDLNLEDAGGTDCLPTDTIFEELARMGAKTTAWNEFSSTMASAIICLATNQKFNLSKYIFDALLGDMSHHKKTYVNPSHTKKIFANMKREGKDFSRRVTPLFATMMVQANQEEGVNSKIPTDYQWTPITTQPSTSKPQKKQSRRKQRKDIEVSQSIASTEPMNEKETSEESILKHSYDPSQSGEDRIQLHELMNLCTNLSDRVLALETTKTTQALEIASLKSREDASKQGRSIEDIDKDAEVSLVDETQGRSDDTEMFDTDALIGDEVFAEINMTKKEHDVIPKEVSAAKILNTAGIKIPISTAAPSTTAVSPPVITEVEITLAQTLAELKSAKSKVVIQEPVQSTVTTAPSTILKAKGITFRDAGETTTRTPTSVSSSSIKDKGKAKMVEPEVPLNKKDQIRLDEELARRLDAEEQEAARLERENVELQEQATLAKIEEWDNVQAMMDADYELCKRLQEQEQGELTIEEKSKLFMELMNERKRHFAKLRAEEKRRKPLTKGQRRNQMCTYLKNMGGFTHNQLKNKSYEEIQKAFDKTMGWINNFKPMDSEEVKISGKKER
ncbi:hypothetical protein Tco_0257724 [Tanacetum coccineum]